MKTEEKTQESKSEKDLFKEIKEIVECKDIVITELLVKRDKDIAQKIRLIGEDETVYVYTPKKTVTTKSDMGGIPTFEDKQELFTMTELLIEYPILKAIVDELKVNKKAVMTVTYMHTNRWSNFENCEVWHNWFYKSQFASIHFEAYHKTDHTNLAIQIQARDDRKKKREGESL